jgi:hypothetical protein
MRHSDITIKAPENMYSGAHDMGTVGAHDVGTPDRHKTPLRPLSFATLNIILEICRA